MISKYWQLINNTVIKDIFGGAELNKRVKKERIEFFGAVLIGGIVPVVLILTGIIPYSWRFIVIFTIAIGLIIIEKMRHGISWLDLGFRRDNLETSVYANIILSIAIVALLLTAFAGDLIRQPIMVHDPMFYVFYVILLAPIQELLFRSIVFAKFKRCAIERPATKIILSALIFVIPHLIYRDGIILAVSLSIGLVWGWMYNRYPNFIGVALSHSILGATAIAVGLI
jgi:hypothetical protein